MRDFLLLVLVSFIFSSPMVLLVVMMNHSDNIRMKAEMGWLEADMKRMDEKRDAMVLELSNYSPPPFVNSPFVAFLESI